jgi:hypothetical protein
MDAKILANELLVLGGLAVYVRSLIHRTNKTLAAAPRIALAVAHQPLKAFGRHLNSFWA